MRFFNKRGISPLIATVLLIGFTVALAGVVITWGGGFVERITSGTEERTERTLACTSDLRFEIGNVVCDDGTGASKVTVENKGSVNLEEINLRFFNQEGTLTGDSQTLGALEKYEIRSFDLVTAIPAGTSKIEALASLIVEGQIVTCGEAVKEKVFAPGC